jgi:3'-5' exoribonuclease
MAAPTRTVEQMELDLRDLIATVHTPYLQALLEELLGPETVTWALYRELPAAKHYHQAYPHGLLEHSLTVAQAVSALSAIFPGIDRDLALTGAILHDIGKIDTYELREDGIGMSDNGRLYGEIPLGYYRLRREIERIPEFPHPLEQALLHIILSHHGQLEHGSPVVPSTREAMLVHMADNLGSKLGSFDRIERELEPGVSWGGYDRGLGTSAFFGREGAEPSAVAAPLRAALAA